METLKCTVEADKEKAQGQLLPRCSICDLVPMEGIAGGIRVKSGFICRNCEQQILLVKTGSKEYEYFLEKIKALFK